MKNNLKEWAWKQVLSPDAKLILLALTEAEQGNKCCITYIILAEKVGLDTRLIKKSIDKLIKHGLIIQESEEPVNITEGIEGFEDRRKDWQKQNASIRTFAFVSEL